ncbi:MAG: hypothetical protein RRZ84_02510 [Romboutsia sp.]
MDLDLIFKIVLVIVVIGVSVKAIKMLTGIVFKIALVSLVLLLLYKMIM